MQNYSEDTLIKRTTADSMGQQFRWRRMLAWNNEDFGSVDLRALSTADERGGGSMRSFRTIAIQRHCQFGDLDAQSDRSHDS